jgi:hypothetical protein
MSADDDAGDAEMYIYCGCVTSNEAELIVVVDIFASLFVLIVKGKPFKVPPFIVSSRFILANKLVLADVYCAICDVEPVGIDDEVLVGQRV